MTKIVIEWAEAKDIEVLNEIEKECFAEQAFPKRFLKYLILYPNSIFLKARIDGKIVGFIAGVLQSPQRVGRIYTLDVKPEFRRRGIASKLLQTLEVEFKNRGIAFSILEVEATNTAALVLYQKFGYRPVRVLKNYYGKNRHGLQMVKNLV
ncbi:MAG: GNAT family N-acetyltransferase [Candidatus Freyarchaeota archaeon]|nr:GNAT family N-acetyltransferase [Candidatus Jordarchaeia archaeon]MBS7281502.1 GNAT family N-acetyltransferase [Candidatus Jordarchaeia archaeon]